jgi:rod shape-determining protein MreD
MGKTILKTVIWATLFALVAALLQSTLFYRLAVYYHAVPDMALAIIVYTAYNNGTMTGQLTGFFSGLMLDFLSAAPLGLNAFIRTLIGALTGLMKGTFFLDMVFLPMVLCAAATCIKAAMLFVLHLMFARGVPTYSFIEPVFWVEIILNTILAPFLFAFLKLFKSLLLNGRET